MDTLKWKLFLDDDAYGYRHPKISVENTGWRRRAGMSEIPPQLEHLGDWVISLSYEEAVLLIEKHGYPSFVSFDHDLGNVSDKTGYDLAKYLVERDLDNGDMPDDFGYEIHSSNPVGRENIDSLFKGYLEHRTANVNHALRKPSPIR